MVTLASPADSSPEDLDHHGSRKKDRPFGDLLDYKTSALPQRYQSVIERGIDDTSMKIQQLKAVLRKDAISNSIWVYHYFSPC